MEVISGETVPADAVQNLERWTGLPDNPTIGGLLVHGGKTRFRIKGFDVLPWFLGLFSDNQDEATRVLILIVAEQLLKISSKQPFSSSSISPASTSRPAPSAAANCASSPASKIPMSSPRSSAFSSRTIRRPNVRFAVLQRKDVTRPGILEPDANGTIFRFFEVRPEREHGSPEDREREAQERLAAMSEQERAAAIARRPDTSRHPGMHKTRTVDYIILLKGEVTMLVDEGEVHLKPFDVVIQRGTNHAWVNRGGETAVLVAVMVEAEPLPRPK